jgi:hypothetical protein
VFLGPNLIPFLMLALGAALFVGNGLAMLRPRSAPREENELERAPIGRSILMLIVGLVAAIWALGTLLR